MLGFFENLTFDKLLHEKSLRPASFRSMEYHCPLVEEEADKRMFKLKPETIKEIIYGKIKSDYDKKIYAPVENRDSMLYPDHEYRSRSVQDRINTAFKRLITYIKAAEESEGRTFDRDEILRMFDLAVTGELRDTSALHPHVGILNPANFRYHAWFYPAVIKDLKTWYGIRFKETGKGQKLEDDQDRHSAAKAAASLLHDQHFHPYFIDGIVQDTSKKGRRIGCLTEESYNELGRSIERAIIGQDVDGDVKDMLDQKETELLRSARFRNVVDEPEESGSY